MCPVGHLDDYVEGLGVVGVVVGIEKTSDDLVLGVPVNLTLGIT